MKVIKRDEKNKEIFQTHKYTGHDPEKISKGEGPEWSSFKELRNGKTDRCAICISFKFKISPVSLFLFIKNIINIFEKTYTNRLINII